MLIKPRMPSSRAIAAVTSTMRVSISAATVCVGYTLDRVAGMDAGPFDVFEDAGNEDILAVEDGIDFDFQTAQILVDEQRRARRRSAARL